MKRLLLMFIPLLLVFGSHDADGQARREVKNGKRLAYCARNGLNKQQCNMGALTGTAKCCITGRPLTRLSIQAEGRAKRKARTNAQGTFMLRRLPRGEYALSAGGQLLGYLKVNKRRSRNLGDVCVCPEGLVQCGDSCVALLSDQNNCGACGNVCASGSACLTGVCTPNAPALVIKKLTNGEDADIIPGPSICAGEAILWSYVVTNVGATDLIEVSVSDDQGVLVTCPSTALSVGESMTCTGSGVARLGQYANVGTATGMTGAGGKVCSKDASHYFGKECVTPTPTPITACPETPTEAPTVTCTTAPTVTPTETPTGAATETPTATPTETPIAAATPTGSPTITPPPPLNREDCTSVFWISHAQSWAAAGYRTSQTVLSVFSGSAAYPLIANSTLWQALAFPGGLQNAGVARILLRAAAAALLNASHPDVDYPRTAASVIADVNAALGSGDRDTMLALAAALGADNNERCPLNNK